MEVLALLIASPLLPALVAVGGVLATIWFNNRRERDRLEHERALRLRDERIGAYRRLLAAASKAHTEPAFHEALAAAFEEVTLLAESPKLMLAAGRVLTNYWDVQETKRKMDADPPEATTEDFLTAMYKEQTAREKFRELARKELGVDP